VLAGLLRQLVTAVAGEVIARTAALLAEKIAALIESLIDRYMPSPAAA
jgi:hypothetical protein